MVANFEDEVQEAMRVLQSMPPEQTATHEANSPEFEAEVQEAMKILQGEEYTLGERAGQVARGAASTYGGLLDLLGNAVTAPAQEFVHAHMPSKEREPEDKPYAEKAAELVDKLVGEKDLTPTDKTGKFLQGVGQFMAPLPIPGSGGYINAAKTGIGALAKHLGKESAIAGGASAAINLTPKLAEEGTLASVAEDVGKAIAGAKA